MSSDCVFRASLRKIFSLRRRIALVTAAFVVGILMFELHRDSTSRFGDEVMFEGSENGVSGTHYRKLLHGRLATELEPNRAWGDNKCSKSDIVINQGPTAPLPSGIPTYTVEISNVCATGCNISAVHLRCGWFSSARLINPAIFKRLRYDDCLVNAGKTLAAGRTVSFQYANTFSYPLSVASVIC